MKKLSCLLLMLVCLVAMPLGAQTTNQVIKSWNLLTFSDETVKNLEADTEHWEYNSKGRYANTQPNDGEELKANGVVIKETAGLFIGAGMEAGTLLLRHAMGDNNGLQMQRNRPIRIDGLLAGQSVIIKMISSSKDSHGISEVSNLEGEVGESTYKAQNINTYSLRVVADGSISFTNSGGVVYKEISINEAVADERPQLPKMRISQVQEVDTVINGMDKTFKRISLACDDPQATIYFTTTSFGNIKDYQQVYNYLPDYIEYLKEQETALEQIHSAAPIVEKRYYDLTGRRIDAAENGIFIQENIHSDGHISRIKVAL